MPPEGPSVTHEVSRPNGMARSRNNRRFSPSSRLISSVLLLALSGTALPFAAYAQAGAASGAAAPAAQAAPQVITVPAPAAPSTSTQSGPDWGRGTTNN